MSQRQARKARQMANQAAGPSTQKRPVTTPSDLQHAVVQQVVQQIRSQVFHGPLPPPEML